MARFVRRVGVMAALAALFPAAPAHAETIVADEIAPALYVARDADSIMYLYGTVHVRRRGAPWGGADAQAALAESDEIWTEMEMSPEADAQARAVVAEIGAAPEERPLSSWLRAEEALQLKALLRRLGLAEDSLEHAQPWLASLTLSMAPMIQAGFDPMSGVDRAVDAAGDAAGKRMRAFETARDQLQFMAALSDEAQREMLLEAINESETAPAELSELTAAWERGDTATMERVIIDEMRGEYPELYDVLFRQRNAEWVTILMQELDGAGVDFVAVGAGHLLGEDGLVAQLRARGISVERVGD